MTIAALLFAKTFPVVITDTLISTKGGRENEIDTPLTSAEKREGFDGYKPAGIAQKMWHSQNLFFLYAGTVSDAERLFRFVDNKMHYGGSVYTDEVHADVKRYAKDNKLDVSFIVVCKNPDDFIHHYPYRAIQADGPLFGRCLMIGSGAPPLVTLLDMVRGAPLPPEEEYEHISVVYQNALRALAAVTIDYLNEQSLLAAKATGAFFNLSFLPELYAFKLTEIPPIIASGVCQIFLKIAGDHLFVKRVVISRQVFGQSTNDVILMDQELPIKAADQSLYLPAHTLRVTTIRMTRQDKSWFDYVTGDSYGVSSVIVYVEKALSDKPGDVVRQKKILLNDPPLLSISQTVTGVSLLANEPFMQSVVEHLARYEVNA